MSEIDTKQPNRIVYLEKTIEKLKYEHCRSLIALHVEIERLSHLVSELKEKPVVKEYCQADSQTNPIPETVNTFQQTIAQSVDSKYTQVVLQTKEELVSTDPYICETCANESFHEESRQSTPKEEQSLYFLVQKEKEKYKTLLQRTFEDKKRRQQENFQLRQELEVIKSVLKMAGLQFDYKEYLEAKQRITTPITIIKNADLRNKQALLPPIPKQNEQTIQELQNETSNEKERLIDFSDLTSEFTAVPPQEQPNRFQRKRPYSAGFIDQIPAILAHNQNLDYNNRAHIHLDNVVYQLDPPLITETKEIPPVIEKKIFQKTEALIPELKKTNYASRLWRAKVVREKHIRDLRDKV